MDLQNLSDMPLETPEQRSKWLNIVLYSICDFIPVITEANAYNIALGHPLSMWLYQNHEKIENICKSEPPECRLALIRLPPLIYRFRKFLKPHIEEFNDKTILEVQELWPGYLSK